MAIIGNNPASPDMDYSNGVQFVPDGIYFTATEDGDVDSIWFYGTSDTDHDWYAALFSISGDDATLICDQTAVYNTPSTSAAWHEIPLDTGSISNGTTYCIQVASTGGTGDARLAKGNGGAIGGQQFTDYYNNTFSFGGVWSSGTGNPGQASDDMTIYLEYTPSGGGAANTPPIGSLSLLGVGL